jgi:hypothetical protein
MVLLGGLYGNSRHKPCKGNKANRPKKALFVAPALLVPRPPATGATPVPPVRRMAFAVIPAVNIHRTFCEQRFALDQNGTNLSKIAPSKNAENGRVAHEHKQNSAQGRNHSAPMCGVCLFRATKKRPPLDETAKD